MRQAAHLAATQDAGELGTFLMGGATRPRRGVPGRADALIKDYGAQDPCPAAGPTPRNRVGLISEGDFQILVACSKS